VRSLCGGEIAGDWLAVCVNNCVSLHCGGFLVGLIAAYDAPRDAP